MQVVGLCVVGLVAVVVVVAVAAALVQWWRLLLRLFHLLLVLLPPHPPRPHHLLKKMMSLHLVRRIQAAGPKCPSIPPRGIPRRNQTCARARSG